MDVTVGFSLQQFSEVFKIRDADGHECKGHILQRASVSLRQ